MVLPGGVLPGCRGVAGVLPGCCAGVPGSGLKRAERHLGLNKKRDAGKAKQAGGRCCSGEGKETRQQIYLVSLSTVQVRSKYGPSTVMLVTPPEAKKNTS